MIDLSNFAKTLNDKPAAIFGLGLSGLATVEALRRAQIKTIAWDDNETSRIAATDKGALCQPLNAETLKDCACLILSPGVPLTHPAPHDVVIAAQTAGIEIIGDVEVLHRAAHGLKTIGITGTNGKSTTTALLTHTLNACGKNAIMCGNIGVPVLQINPKSAETILVLEMSSYQIDLCPTFRPDIGILLNITPDHIDRHGSFENYAAVKHRMLEGAQHKILGEGMDGNDPRLAGHDFPMLMGEHNKQNIFSVLDTCKILGIETAEAIAAIKTFPGLAHRQYFVRRIGNVSYINDSKATNAEATATALSAHKNIYWIAGGHEKEGGLNGLEPVLPNIKHAFLIGEAAEGFAAWLNNHNIPNSINGTLGDATEKAHHMAHAYNEDAAVLLSPACASWDQFKSFEHRGDAFAKIVEGLK